MLKKTKWSDFSIIWSEGLEREHQDKSLELRSINSNCFRNPTWIRNPSRIRIGQSKFADWTFVYSFGYL
jgi:hypothetical protein